MILNWGKILWILGALLFFLSGCNELTEKKIPKELTAQEIYLQASILRLLSFGSSESASDS